MPGRPSCPEQPGSRTRDKPDRGGLFTKHVVLVDETTRFILVNALDFFVTYILLAWPDTPGYEANPIARQLMQLDFRYLIPFKFGMAAVAVVCCEQVARWNPRVGRYVLNALTLVIAAVAGYGTWLIAHHLAGW